MKMKQKKQVKCYFCRKPYSMASWLEKHEPNCPKRTDSPNDQEYLEEEYGIPWKRSHSKASKTQPSPEGRDELAKPEFLMAFNEFMIRSFRWKILARDTVLGKMIVEVPIEKGEGEDEED